MNPGSRKLLSNCPPPSPHLPAGECLNHRQSPQPGSLLVPRPQQEPPVSLYSGKPQVSPITLAQSSTYKSRGEGKGGSVSLGAPGASGRASLCSPHPLGHCSVEWPLVPAILGPLGGKWGWGRGCGRALALYPAHIINERITDFWRSHLPEVLKLGVGLEAAAGTFFEILG